MIDDPVVEEIRAHRQAHAARFNYDLAAIFADLVEREKSSSRPVINRPSRRIPEMLKTDISQQHSPVKMSTAI
ncbi:MAG: hypothetical protein ACOYOE_13710, partial [Chlorobium sp.]